jgi:RNA polymerase sigma-70 factor (ECF subfamily)
LKSFSHFLSDRRRYSEAEKRGGEQIHFPIDVIHGENRYQNVPADQATPDQLFERQWALTLLDTAMSRLREEYEQSGKAELLEQLLPHLSQDSDARPYAEIAESLVMNETALKVAAYRMRKRYRAILRAEIADTLHERSESEIDEELHWLITIVGG